LVRAGEVMLVPACVPCEVGAALTLLSRHLSYLRPNAWPLLAALALRGLLVPSALYASTTPL
jgi:hypothetical protein